ncbi:hypothetical protein VTH06DRAFT_2950 [Thermothelomyces fergusii]
MNKDAITLKEILGDPLIAECWEFNYLHDIDFLMAAFDPDVRHLVKVHVVHGFWKREDPSRLELQEAASRFQNVTLHSAFMPEMYGTHHSKMMILLRHDDTAQIVIHTANMIVRDWTNMTQAVWLSPRLPLMEPSQADARPEDAAAGSGAKFKIDLLNYLRAYDARRATCKPIIDKLSRHDFSAIRGSLIASVPGRHRLNNDGASPTRWGWAAMEQALKSVPVSAGRSDIAVQVSSIATLGPTDAWLRGTLFRALGGGRPGGTLHQPPNFRVIFPTPDEIRKSLDGYGSGASIHTKIQSPQQAKQLAYLRPMLHHWANDSADGADSREGSRGVGGDDGKTGEDGGGDSAVATREAGRKRAAPHIKTYIRYGDTSGPSIDWVLVTSANLSKQAWGEAAVRGADGGATMRIASYEIGVLVWPGLYGEGAVMRGTFLTDSLGPDEVEEGTTAVALRMPYNLPLQPYGKGEVPWVATADHSEPDWKGRVWRGHVEM